MSETPSRSLRVLGIGVLVLGALLLAGRFVDLDGESAWLDEAFTLRVAPMDLASILRVSKTDVHPPLYYVLLHPLMRFTDRIGPARAFSAVFGVLTVCACAAAARCLFGTGPALVAGLLAAVNPFLFYYSREARMHIVCAFFAAAALWLFVRELKQPSRLGLVAYAAASVAALYTFYYGAFALASEILFLLIYARTYRERLRRLLAAQAAAVLLFLPWVPVLLGQIRIVESGYWISKYAGPVSPLLLPEVFVRMTSGSPLFQGHAGLGLLTAAVAGGLLGLFLVPSGRLHAMKGACALLFLYLAVPFAAGIALSFKERVILDRYFVVAAAALFPLLAAAAWAARPRRTAAVLVVALAALNGIEIYDELHAPRKGPLKEMAAYVEARIAPDDAVLHLNTHSYFPFVYYGGGRLRQYVLLQPGMRIDQEKVLLPLDAGVPSPAEVFRRYQRVWVVAVFPFRGRLEPPPGMTVSERREFHYEKSWTDGQVARFERAP